MNYTKSNDNTHFKDGIVETKKQFYQTTINNNKQYLH